MPSITAAAHPVCALDPFSTEFLADPYPFHEKLRESGPVVWLEKYGVWAMARYEQVHAALNDWQTFCSSAGVGLSNFHKEKPWRAPSLVLEADPPQHTRARRVLSRVLSRPVVERLRKRFEQEAEALVDTAIALGGIDGVRNIAEVFPLKVFPDAVGLQEAGRENLLPYANMAFNAFGPRNKLFDEAFAEAATVSEWIIAQCRRESLGKDGLGAAIYTEADAGQLTQEEAGMLVRSLLTAGLDTTIHGISSALYSFASYPDQWKELREDPSLVRAAFDEAIRLQSPVQTFFRTTVREVEVAGVRLGADEKVLLFLAAANRDPRKWERAEQFDIRRKAVGHVGFGNGIHMCVGQMVARLEAEVVLAALAKKVESIELAGEPKRRLNNTLRGFSGLPLILHPAT